MSAQSEIFAQRLRAVWQRSDQILGLIPQHCYLDRPIGLRHPFLFYLGHLPAFAWNQVACSALGLPHFSQLLDLLFERGIDPDGEDGARAQSIQQWPSPREVLSYRDAVRTALLPLIPQVLDRPQDALCAHGRVLNLVIEHELMHQETLLYMLAECPPGIIPRSPLYPLSQGGAGRAAEQIFIPEGEATIGAHFSELPFGWDNEFEQTTVTVPSFLMDSLPVRNSDWLAFFASQGHAEDLFPNAWLRGPTGLQVKTVFGPVPFEQAEGWPVQVTGQQARVFCAAAGGQLPTEAELHRAAYGSPDHTSRYFPWGSAAPTAEHGNFGFRQWSPVPTGLSPAGASAFGVEELVGNGWEWTCTPFAPLPGFRAWARSYPGYSQDFFDGAHDIVFGASWATDEVLLRPSFRNWYRRSYPYPFSSFRVVRK